MPAEFRLAEIARLVDGQLVGDADITITGVGTIEDSDEGDLVLIEDPDLLERGEACRAAAILAPPSARSTRKPLIVTEDPRLAFSRILELFAPEPSVPVGVHPTAIIGKGVHLGRDVAIGPYVVIEEGVRIGDRVVIYPFVFIGREGDVGDGTIIYPHVFIGERVSIGERCIIHAGAAIGADGFGFLQTPHGHKKIPQIGTVVVEDEVEIGANTTIDRATVSTTRIGAGTKIDDQVHIAHNCVIGRNCILCGQVGIAGSSIIGDNCVLGGKAAVSDHVRIGDNVTIAGRAAVFGDISQPGVYSGYPARPHHQQLRLLAMTQRLPQLQKTVEELRAEVEELRGRLQQLQGNR
ncbi:MAG: UDP-3-O-(3-hydroxymyristoyl)glucosamine N-acyltransferase [Armatimonadetes bacterium]|nr:UDP-3-O-(3-hydroxymyristoyl)glucosamine N-acyltransferase [Armatimonadota bacterium]